MTFVTFIIAMAAIGAFYFYSTKPACRAAVNNWSLLACDALQEKALESFGKVIKQKVAVDSIMQPFRRLIEVPAEALTAASTLSSGSTGSRLGPSDNEKPEGETHAGATALRSATLNQEENQPAAFRVGETSADTALEKGLVTGEKKKKKKKSKSKSKKKKSSKKSKTMEEALPDDM
ncbi:unnamed protein product [Cercopithifilaria johnstoni]|uniref:Uncharacterized protein n=1 Tax=Cercopithifilaria johnstoni TaxID=2874296 RepID=A0A8J2LYY5_9BILA|nr:unnamed protein product [Cercopithifilaria johnstoni]